MTVAELIEHLKTLEQNWPVVMYSNHDEPFKDLSGWYKLEEDDLFVNRPMKRIEIT